MKRSLQNRSVVLNQVAVLFVVVALVGCTRGTGSSWAERGAPAKSDGQLPVPNPSPAPGVESTPTPSSGSGEGHSPAATTNLPVDRSFEVSVAQIQDPAGCLNLQKLAEKLNSLPAGISVRETTVDSTLLGYSATSEFRRHRAVQAFDSKTKSASLFAVSPRIQQTGCEEVSKVGRYGRPVHYEAKGLGQNELRLSSESMIETYVFTEPNTLLIKRQARVFDACSERQSQFTTETTTLVRWDTAERLAQTPENLATSYLKNVVNGLSSPPESLTALVASQANSKTVALSQEQLDAIVHAEESQQTRRCGPAPTPTPAPSASPRSNQPAESLNV